MKNNKKYGSSFCVAVMALIAGVLQKNLCPFQKAIQPMGQQHSFSLRGGQCLHKAGSTDPEAGSAVRKLCLGQKSKFQIHEIP